jgi:hypothetical protein
MNKTLITVSMTTIVALGTPILSLAAAVPKAHDNCVKAFVASLPEKIGGAPRLLESHYIDKTFGDTVPAELEMTASRPTDNKTVWRAVCYVNSRGEVTGMRDTKLTAGL